MAKGFHPHFAGADFGVTIDPASEFSDAVIEMKGADPFDPYDAVEFVHSGAEFDFRGDRIPGGEDVASVHTDADALGCSDAVGDPRQVLEFVTEITPLPSGRLQQRDRLEAPGPMVRLVESSDNPRESFIF